MNQIIDTYFQALTTNKELDKIPLAVNVRFSGPLKEEEFEGEPIVRSFLEETAFQMSKLSTKELHRLIDENKACLIFEVTLLNGKTIGVCDFLTIKKGKIISIKVYTDPRPFFKG